MDIKYPVNCPLIGKEIDEETCFDIHCVVDGGAPDDIAPEEVFNDKNFRDTCKACVFHRDD